MPEVVTVAIRTSVERGAAALDLVLARAWEVFQTVVTAVAAAAAAARPQRMSNRYGHPSAK